MWSRMRTGRSRRRTGITEAKCHCGAVTATIHGAACSLHLPVTQVAFRVAYLKFNRDFRWRSCLRYPRMNWVRGSASRLTTRAVCWRAIRATRAFGASLFRMLARLPALAVKPLLSQSTFQSANTGPPALMECCTPLTVCTFPSMAVPAVDCTELAIRTGTISLMNVSN